MKRMLILTVVCFVVASNFNLASASLSSDSGMECGITTEVMENDLSHDTATEVALEQMPPITQFSRGWSRVRIMEIKKTNVHYANKNFCEEKYSIGEEVITKIPSNVMVGSIIKGDLSFTSDDWTFVYFLKNVELVSNGDVIEVGGFDDNGIDYNSDCQITSNNFSVWFCGGNWQQTNFNKTLFISLLVIIVVATIVIFIKLKNKK